MSQSSLKFCQKFGSTSRDGVVLRDVAPFCNVLNLSTAVQVHYNTLLIEGVSSQRDRPAQRVVRAVATVVSHGR